MTLAVCCMSHTPLLEVTDPGPDLTADVETAMATARDLVRVATAPKPVIVFAPDVTTAVRASATVSSALG
jgi:2,3-dihydroxyphenylpropionate 1,2-dioxygenase